MTVTIASNDYEQFGLFGAEQLNGQEKGHVQTSQKTAVFSHEVTVPYRAKANVKHESRRRVRK